MLKWKKYKRLVRRRVVVVLVIFRINESVDVVDVVDVFSEDDYEEKLFFYFFFDIEVIYTGRYDFNLLIVEVKYDYFFCFKGEIILYIRFVYGYCL